MDQGEKKQLLGQLVWDYSTSVDDIEAVINGIKQCAGHLTREKLFVRMLESYPWFTIVQLMPVEDIHKLLTAEVISQLRSKSLQEKYEFVRYRLQQIIPAAG